MARVCVTLLPDGTAGGGFGRAPRVAIATVEDGAIAGWEEHDVRWDELHDVGTEGGHHARIARFLIDQRVQVVAAGHVGPPMQQQLAKMRIGLVMGIEGDARDVAAAAASTPA